MAVGEVQWEGEIEGNQGENWRWKAVKTIRYYHKEIVIKNSGVAASQESAEHAMDSWMHMNGYPNVSEDDGRS